MLSGRCFVQLRCCLQYQTPAATTGVLLQELRPLIVAAASLYIAKALLLMMYFATPR